MSGIASGKKDRAVLFISHRALGARKDEDFPRWCEKCVWSGENQVPHVDNNFNWNLSQVSCNPILVAKETQFRGKKCEFKILLFFPSVFKIKH